MPIKSFWIELTAINFLSYWKHAGKSKVYYDYMVRDYLDYLAARENTSVYASGTLEAMNLGDAWVSKAKTALARAQKACGLESTDPTSAGDEWQKIFGQVIPRNP